MYNSNEIWIGKVLKVVPSWFESLPSMDPRRVVPATVVYIHPDKRFFAVEHTFKRYEAFGVERVSKIRECYQMCPPERIARPVKGIACHQIRRDYDDERK